MKEKIYYMDILRIIALLTVLYTHYVWVATFDNSSSSSSIINIKYSSLPLFDKNAWHFYALDNYLITNLRTEIGTIGTLVFFLASGYLMTVMLERYNRVDFIINRIFKVYPCLIFSIMLLGCFMYFTQGLVFSLKRYLASFSLLYLFLGIVPVIAILWTLIVEIMFYFIIAVVGKLNFYKVLLLQSCMLGLIYVSTFNHNNSIYLLAYNFQYILYTLIGTVIRLSESENNMLNKICLVFHSFLISYLGFQIFMLKNPEPSFFQYFISQILGLMVFLLFYATQKLTMPIFKKLPRGVYFTANLLYPFYLVHVVIGFVIISFLRNYLSNQYLVLLGAIIFSYLCAWMIHVTVELPSMKLGRHIIKYGMAQTSKMFFAKFSLRQKKEIILSSDGA